MKDFIMDASVRLVCNYSDLPFHADKEEELAHRVTERVSIALERSGDAYAYLMPEGMKEENKRRLSEKRLLHPDTNAAPYSVLYLRMDEKVSVQTALADHAVISVHSPEGDLLACQQTARQIRRQLAETGSLAYDDDYGYLTAHPCDAGTGMRCSVLLHLPMLQLTRQMEKIKRKALSEGAVLRPASNDLNQVMGNLYLLENRAALGKNAEDMAADVLKIAEQIVRIEKQCREIAKEKTDEVALDAVWRAYGIAQYVRCITKKDAMNLWSHLSLGTALEAYRLSEQALSGMWDAACGTIEQKQDEKPVHPDVLRARKIRALINGGE